MVPKVLESLRFDCTLFHEILFIGYMTVHASMAHATHDLNHFDVYTSYIAQSIPVKLSMHNDLCDISFITDLFRFKGRFLLFQVYRNFADLFFKLSVSTFYKEISKFQQKVQS